MVKCPNSYDVYPTANFINRTVAMKLFERDLDGKLTPDVCDGENDSPKCAQHLGQVKIRQLALLVEPQWNSSDLVTVEKQDKTFVVYRYFITDD